MARVNTLVSMHMTGLKHVPAFLHRTCGLQRLPDEAPHFTESVVVSFSCIRVIPRHPQGMILFPHACTHSTSFPTVTQCWSGNVPAGTLRSIVEIAPSPCRSTALPPLPSSVFTRHISFYLTCKFFLTNVFNCNCNSNNSNNLFWPSKFRRPPTDKKKKKVVSDVVFNLGVKKQNNNN